MWRTSRSGCRERRPGRRALRPPDRDGATRPGSCPAGPPGAPPGEPGGEGAGPAGRVSLSWTPRALGRAGLREFEQALAYGAYIDLTWVVRIEGHGRERPGTGALQARPGAVAFRDRIESG